MFFLSRLTALLVKRVVDNHHSSSMIYFYAGTSIPLRYEFLYLFDLFLCDNLLDQRVDIAGP
jgi:hypothetical protein